MTWFSSAALTARLITKLESGILYFEASILHRFLMFPLKIEIFSFQFWKRMITQDDFLGGVTSRVGWNDQIIIVQTEILFRVKEGVVIMWDNRNKSKLSRENWDYGHSSCRRKQFYRLCSISME